MKNAYNAIRLANVILNRAEDNHIESDFVVEVGDQWVNGQCGDDVNDRFPEFCHIMTDLEMEYDREDLIPAFELLIEVGNQNAF